MLELKMTMPFLVLKTLLVLFVAHKGIVSLC